jgi:hypothetical protein
MTAISGCGGPKSDRPSVVPARGRVTYRGEPVADAVLVFNPSTTDGFAASASTDPQGAFDLKTFPPESGAVPGTYSVAILKVSQEDIYAEGNPKRGAAQPTSLIPARYGNPSKSGLQLEVPADGTDQLLIELTD